MGEKCYLCRKEIDMATNSLIYTDTDIFGWINPPAQDKYQLIYGIFKYAQNRNVNLEKCLYNLVASLLNEYKEPLLREMKITCWIDLIEYVDDWCKKSDTKEGCFFLVPFLDKTAQRISLQHLRDALSLMRGALLSAKNNYIQEYPIIEDKSFTYPLPSIRALLGRLYKSFLVPLNPVSQTETTKRLEEWRFAMAEGVLWEMSSRSLFWIEEGKPGLKEENRLMYDTYLLKRTTDNKDYNPSDVNEVKDLTIKQRVGVIMFMMECFEVKDKEKVRKIAHFVVKDKEPYSNKTNSNDTIYSILHNDKQIFKLTPYFKEVLKKYGLPIPDGLEDLDKRMFD